METVSQQTFIENTNEILERVSEKQIPILVTMDDQPIVVILPYETYLQLTKFESKESTAIHGGVSNAKSR
jgi:prevent-host-death family protein